VTVDSVQPNRGSVVTIGVFDGVHRGHRALLAQARAVADEMSLPLIAVTFDPHPLEVVRPGFEPHLLASVAYRFRLLREAGAHRVEVLHFDHAMSQLTPEEFVDEVLVDRLGVKAIVIGENFTFGHRAAGNVQTLTELGASRGFSVIPAELVTAPEGVLSSTWVRALVAEGRVAEAAQALMRPHRVEGTVVHGDHRGREIGYPTANLGDVARAAIPADGVYAGFLVVDPQGAATALPAAISVGTNPTFGENSRRVEAYVIDSGHELALYDLPVAVDFVENLRPMVAFDDIDSLLTQMAADVDQAREITSRG